MAPATSRASTWTHPRGQYPWLHRIGGTFKTVDNTFSTVFNQALGINNSDETVGYYAPTAAGPPGDIAYSQEGGTFTDINHLLPTNFNSQAVGINSTATPWIVGFYQPDGLTTSFGFVDEGGTITTIDPFGSTFTQALGVNDLGEIVGFYVGATAISMATSTTAASSPVSTRRARLRRRSTASTIRATLSASTPTPRQTPLTALSGRPVAGAFDLGDDAGRLRGAWFPRLSQGAPGEAGGLRATLMVAVGRATATHLFRVLRVETRVFP